jgi:hypothetical protein
MSSPCDPPRFDEQDWSQFDFSRWHLDGLTTGDAAATALGELAQQFFGTPEWRQHFAATAPEIQGVARGFYQNHLAELREEKAVLQRDFTERVAVAEERAGDYRRTLATSAEPPPVDPDPSTFRLAVKIIGGAKAVGLSGLVIRVLDPENERMPLVETVTDSDGNATLSVPPERAGELKEVHTTLTVRSLDGKSLQELKEAICIRLNQTETKIVRLADSADLAPYIAAALEGRAAREKLLQNLIGRVERLRAEQDTRLRDLDCRVTNTEKLIADFDSPPEIPVNAVDRRSAATGQKPPGDATMTRSDTAAEVAPEGGPPETAQPAEAAPEAPEERPRRPKGRKRKKG